MSKSKNSKINQNVGSDDNDNSCQDKLAFDNQKQAVTAKVVANLQHGATLKTYRCHKCNLWHLTSRY